MQGKPLISHKELKAYEVRYRRITDPNVVSLKRCITPEKPSVKSDDDVIFARTKSEETAGTFKPPAVWKLEKIGQVRKAFTRFERV